MKKLMIKETGKITITVIENNKRIQKITCGKKVKIETVKKVIAENNIETIDYFRKVQGVGGAGLYDISENLTVEDFLSKF